MHKRVRFHVACLLVVGGIMIVGCVGASAAGGPEAVVPKSKVLTITVGISSVNPSFWPYYGGEALGFNKQLNLNVKVVTLTPQDCLRAIVGGSVDACSGTLDNIITALQAGGKAIAVAMCSYPNVSILVVDPKQVQTWSDLRGKAIAASGPYDASSIAIRSVLVKHGVDPAEVAFVTIGSTGARLGALESGKTAAAIVSSPDDLKAINDGYPSLGSSLEGTPVGSFLAAIPGRSAEKDEALRRYIISMAHADTWIANPANHTAALTLWETMFKETPAQAAWAYSQFIVKGKSFFTGVSMPLKIMKGLVTELANLTPIKVTVKAQDVMTTTLLHPVKK